MCPWCPSTGRRTEGELTVSHRVEMHFHTKEVSGCSIVYAADGVAMLRDCGVEAVVTTDHYADYSMGPRKDDWQAAVDWYLSGYRAAKAAGDALGVTVLLGMELRLAGAANEYLVYGVTEQQLREHPRLYELDTAGLCALAKELNWFVAQAHPFRDYMTRCNPDHLEGLEICNACPRHNSRNDEAAAFAAEHGLIGISGSDFHAPEDAGRGGCFFERPVTCIEDVRDQLRAGTFTPIFPEK